MAKLTLDLLGVPRVRVEGQEIVIKQRKALALFAYLAMGQERQMREGLITLLWPDHERKAATAYLRQALWQLNKVLPEGTIQADRQSVQIEPIDVDVHAFEAAFDGARDGEQTDAMLSRFESALKLYRGDFMAGFSLGDSAEFDNWQSLQSEKLRHQRIQIHAQLVEGYSAQRAFESAIWQAKQWLALDPLLEEAHRALMRLFVATGRRQLALDQYEACRALLERELSAEPEPETTQLHNAIRDGKALPELSLSPAADQLGQAVTVPESKPQADTRTDSVAIHGDGNVVHVHVHNGQRETTPFLAPPKPPYQIVGRDRVLRALKQRLFSGEALALSALRGLPGVGKTAVAIELAHDPEVVGHFYDGVLWAGLGREPDILTLLGNWAIALGIEARLVADCKNIPERQNLLKTAIGQKRLLFVVDDAWSSADALAFRIGGRRCGYLLTTRQPAIALDFAGEGLTEVKELSDGDGLLLLSRIAPDAVVAEPLLAIELVRMAAGLPLALILISRYLRKVGYGGQTERLRMALHQLRETQARLRLEQQVMPTHHPSLTTHTTISLQAAISMSVEALSESERSALLSLATFPPKPDSFSAEAALAVAETSPQTLQTLQNAGLLESSGPRYLLHQSVADYGLTVRNDDSSIPRFVSYFVEYIEQNAGKHKLFDLENTNLLEALNLAKTHRLDDLFIRGAYLIDRYLHHRGLYEIEQELLTRAERLAREQHKTVDLLYVLNRSCTLQLAVGDNQRAEASAREGLALAREEGLLAQQCRFLNQLGYILLILAKYDESQEVLIEGEAIARSIGNTKETSAFLNVLGSLAYDRTDVDKADFYWRQGLELEQEREIQNNDAISRFLMQLGLLAYLKDDHAQRQYYYEEALKILRVEGDSATLCQVLVNLATMYVDQGKLDKAEPAVDEALAIVTQSGHRPSMVDLLAFKGELLIFRGKYEEAEPYCKKSLALATQLELVKGSINAKWLSGTLAHKRGLYQEAEAWLQQSLQSAQEIDSFMLIHPILCELAEVNRAMRKFEEATDILNEALELAREAGHTSSVALALFGLAETSAGQGQRQEALKLAQESKKMLVEIGLHGPLGRVEKWLNEQQLNDSAL